MSDKNFKIIPGEADFELKFIEPGSVKFFRAGDALRVTIKGDKSCLRVVPMRAFPISLRNQYISLRDIDGNELGMLKDPKKLDKQSQKLLTEEIRKRYFTPQIHRIIALTEKFNIVIWQIETDRGEKEFLTGRLHNSVKESGSGLIITDLEDNKYEIYDRAELDSRSSALLARYI